VEARILQPISREHEVFVLLLRNIAAISELSMHDSCH
jgi:hypothetical protein